MIGLPFVRHPRRSRGSRDQTFFASQLAHQAVQRPRAEQPPAWHRGVDAIQDLDARSRALGEGGRSRRTPQVSAAHDVALFLTMADSFGFALSSESHVV